MIKTNKARVRPIIERDNYDFLEQNIKVLRKIKPTLFNKKIQPS